jgi:hypothetical protein
VTPLERERLRLTLYVSQKGRCSECRVRLCLEKHQPNSMHLDHVNPRSNLGADEACNLRLMCAKCNIAKSGKLSVALQHTLFDGWGRSGLREPRPPRPPLKDPKNAERQKRFQENRPEGICARCPRYLMRPARPGRTLCDGCHGKMVDRVREWRKKTRLVKKVGRALDTAALT